MSKDLTLVAYALYAIGIWSSAMELPRKMPPID